MTIRVLIADDQALVRAGFRKLLDSAPGLEVVGEAADGAYAVLQARRLQPDVVLMDIRMPGMDGITATRQIVESCGPAGASPDADHVPGRRVRPGLPTGRSQWFPAQGLAPGAPARSALGVIARGDALLDPAVTRTVVSAVAKGSPPIPSATRRIASLTAREVTTLELLATGLSNAEIAQRLVVSEATVKTHVGHLLAKLGLRDRVQAVIFAFDSGLAGPTSPGAHH